MPGQDRGTQRGRGRRRTGGNGEKGRGREEAIGEEEEAEGKRATLEFRQSSESPTLPLIPYRPAACPEHPDSQQESVGDWQQGGLENSSLVYHALCILPSRATAFPHLQSVPLDLNYRQTPHF